MKIAFYFIGMAFLLTGLFYVIKTAPPLSTLSPQELAERVKECASHGLTTRVLRRPEGHPYDTFCDVK